MAKNSKKGKIKTLDLHGFKRDEIFAVLDRFIVNSQNQLRVCIMTGKGLGVVQKETISYLKQAGYPWEYEKSANGKENTGCLIVFI